MKAILVMALIVCLASESYAAIPLRQSCLLPPKPGLCKAYMPRFHYSRAAGTCRQFIYGGCGGNANNFRSLRECLTACSGTRG
ncbi:kunitz-like toxin PcKuz3 [Ornithodoros turicata]|uniref:kunitz-like toxin PcKuz3 n=1 Tax=Ornithodoros turicata TaxID=34597 RepID=UPI0031389C61